MAYNATLGGVGLDQRGGVSWTLRDGISPHTQSFTMDRDAAERIKDGANVDLVMSGTASGEVRSLKVRNLRVIGRTGTRDVHSSTLVVADARWLWTREHVRRTFNKRRASGNKRRIDEDGVIPAEIAPVSDDVTYAEPSLQSKGKPWTAQAMVASVLDEVVGPGNWDGASSLGQFHGKVVDNVEIDMSGEAAVAVVMAYLPGCNVYVDLNGKTRVKNSLSVAASDTLMRSAPHGPHFVDTGSPRFVPMGHQRPREIHVLFEVEQELRFDFLSTRSSTDFGEARYMENVAPVPDASLKMVSGPMSGKTVVRGTWVAFPDLLNAWNADKDGASVADITDAVIRQHWERPWIEAVYIRFGDPRSPNISWAARIATIRQHYRQSFRISRRWMNRIYSLRAYRASVVDLETGNFGASVAYMDYSFSFSTKGKRATTLGKQGIYFAVQKGVNPGSALPGGQVAPADVSIVDDDLGIVRVALTKDLVGNTARIFPGVLDRVPRLDPLGRAFPMTMDGSRRGRRGYSPKLIEAHRCSVIVTAAPFAPNNIGRLHRVKVPLGEAREYLPAAAASAIPNATGPIWEVKVGAGLSTARLGWVHARAADIERSFGVGLPLDSGPPPPTGNPAREAVNDLAVNPDELRVIAKATAAGIYASLPDRWEGQKRIALDAAVTPLGRVRSVTHTVGTGGAHTVLAAPATARRLDPMETLPASVRSLVLGMVQR